MAYYLELDTSNLEKGAKLCACSPHALEDGRTHLANLALESYIGEVESHQEAREIIKVLDDFTESLESAISAERLFHILKSNESIFDRLLFDSENRLSVSTEGDDFDLQYFEITDIEEETENPEEIKLDKQHGFDAYGYNTRFTDEDRPEEHRTYGFLEYDKFVPFVTFLEPTHPVILERKLSSIKV